MRDFIGGWLATLCHYRNDLFAMACIFAIFGALAYAATNRPIFY